MRRDAAADLALGVPELLVELRAETVARCGERVR
jgi:hypothetical protein